MLFNPVKHADFSEVKDNDRGGTGSKCPTFREKMTKSVKFDKQFWPEI